MRRFVDLHTHSTASDGTCTPTELVKLADAEGLAAVALTDHDTTGGLAEAALAAKNFPELRFVSGIEISAQPPSGTLHMLGYDFDLAGAALQDMAAFLRHARDTRNPKILGKLAELGMKLDMAEVLEIAGGAKGEEGDVIGRPHIAEAMRRKGYVATVKEAFDKYLAKGCSAYFDRERPSASEAIRAIHAAGGLAVLAHPVQLKCENSAQLERVLRSLVRDGLDGIEAYHTEHSEEQVREYIAAAERYGLAVTGGSDFHGHTKTSAAIGHPRVPLAGIGRKLADRIFGTAS